MTGTDIKYIAHQNLDYRKWDACITDAFNGIIYAYSWYLDVVSPGWDGLVEGDYETVMPLTKGRKYGINYLYQPFFCQQLGVFSIKKLDAAVVEQFLSSIPGSFRFIEINLNTFNKVSSGTFIGKRNVTYELDLIRMYDKIQKAYATNTRRNIKKSSDAGVYLAKGNDPVQLVEIFRQNKIRELEKIKEPDYTNLQKIMTLALNHKIGQLYLAFNEKHEICAGAFFITSHRKSIMLLSASTREGKDKSAMFAVIDGFIKVNAERNITLDFEGSNVEGIARFYGSFGAKPCDYTTVKINRLPALVKLFKK